MGYYGACMMGYYGLIIRLWWCMVPTIISLFSLQCDIFWQWLVTIGVADTPDKCAEHELFIFLQLQVCQFCFHLSVLCAQRSKSIFNNSTFVSYVKVARLRDRIREECTNYVLHNHHGLFMHQLLHLLSSKLAMNDQIVGHTEYKIHLRSDLRVYCPTSEFSVRPQNLVSDLRI